MTDPVADKSSFLCMYMSNHPDTLVAYVKYFGKVKEKVTSARMTSISSTGMNLSYKIEGNKADIPITIEFDPPLLGYEEVKPRLLAMTADAQESLGMTKVPQIKDFDISWRVLRAGIPVAFLFYTIYAPRYEGQIWSLGQYLHQAVGGNAVVNNSIFPIALGIHIMEALYVQRLAIKHSMPFDVALKYVVSTFFFGFTILVPLRKKIQKARIDSIMKSN